MPTVLRRLALAAIACGVAALAGCGSSAVETLPTKPLDENDPIMPKPINPRNPPKLVSPGGPSVPPRT